jgi:SAM-dependent methyltransferase
MKNSNIEYYNQNVDSFYNSSVVADMSEWRNRFVKQVSDGGRILDVGCGSGRDSKAFIKEGFSVVAFDASREMCKKASELLGQEVWQMRFDEMSFDEEFDGVWACASLLHTSEEEFPEVLNNIYKALKDRGILYASFKYGEGTTQRGERTFIDFTVETIIPILQKTGFEILDSGITTDVRPERENEKWTNVIAIKK